jgi:hypothetical protein
MKPCCWAEWDIVRPEVPNLYLTIMNHETLVAYVTHSAITPPQYTRTKRKGIVQPQKKRLEAQ